MTFQFPWNRPKTIRLGSIELPRIELPRIDGKAIDRATANVSLPKIEAPRLPDVSAASIGSAVDDARKAIGDTAEELVHKAGQIGPAAGKLGKEIAASGEHNLRNLGADLRGLGRDAKSLRITRQKSGPDMMPGIFLLAGLGSGMAAMYFFDPEEGRRRRALLRDQLRKFSRVATETLSGRAEDLRNRSAGLTHEARSAVSDLTGTLAGAANEGRGASLVDETPEAAGELDATDAAARGYDESGIYSTSEPDSIGGSEVASDNGSDETTEREQIYSAYTDTGREN